MKRRFTYLGFAVILLQQSLPANLGIDYGLSTGYSGIMLNLGEAF